MDVFSSVSDRIRRILQKENIKPRDVFSISNATYRRFGLNDDDVRAVRDLVGEENLRNFITASESEFVRELNWKRISFGCDALNRITRNGLAVRGITELSGESGSGKTQITLQLCLNVQLPERSGGLGRGVVFISTEDVFPSKRLFEMATRFQERHRNDLPNEDLLDNIFIEHIDDGEKLFECISTRLPVLMRAKDIGLIIIDSIAAIYRLEANIIQRADDMRKLVQILQILADQHCCAVCCVNQVTSVIDNSGDNQLVPCLGLAWSNLVNTRFQIHKTTKEYSLSNGDGTITPITARSFEVVFSSELAKATTDFLITPDGIVDLPS